MTSPFVAETVEDYRTILDVLPDPVLVMDREGRVTYANRQVAAAFGYEPNELVGRSHDVLIPQRSRELHAQHFERYHQAPVTRRMGVGLTLTARRKDGSEVPVEVSLSPLGTGPRASVVATLRDVCERTRLEQTQKLLATRLSNAVAMFPEALGLFDADDRLVLCNASFRARLRNLPDPIEGRTHAELVAALFDGLGIHDVEERTRLEEMRGALRSGGAGRKVTAPDGSCVRFHERETAEGGTLLMVSDLTEDERIAVELREARIAAEVASRAKSEFLSSMSHELRTPLNAIVGFAELMRRDKRDPLSERGKERIDQIIRAGAHLTNLVDDILDLSRIEAGRVSVSVEPTGVGDVLASVREAIEHAAQGKGVEVVVEPPADEGLRVLADRTRLVQIVTNFATNAVKYNRPGGRAVLTATRPTEGRIRISVSDTGMGIPSEKQCLLFQPFQRAGQETGPVEGTGIGLVIAKRLAEMMGGTVGFESTPGEGSVFWVDVAASSRNQNETSPPRDPPPMPTMLADREVLVLYIEDNPANASFMKALFAAIDDTTLVVARTAEDGVALAREQRPDAILMDINLPGMNGIEALHALRREDGTRHIPVIALTAAASTHEQHVGMREGFAHYLVKPVRLEAILGALASILPR